MECRFILTVFLASIIFHGSAAECTYGNSPPTATIGKRMTLSCPLPCVTGTVYKWVNITESKEAILPETNSELMLSENVTSDVASQLFGQMYECQIECQGTTKCRRFRIGVIPRAYFDVPHQVAKTGSNVNIICMSESYPPAIDVDDYQMKHPNNTPIDKVLLQEGNGVVHIIETASKTEDAGRYLCTVHVVPKFPEYSTTNLQSDAASAVLIVYDPPTIVSVSNFTICNHTQTAVLECVISSTEEHLTVWARWSESEGKTVVANRTEFQSNDIYYLILYNAAPGGYICQVFSAHSPDIPEDTQTAYVKITPDSPIPSSEALTPKPEKGSVTPYIAAIIVLLIISLVLMFLLLLLFVWVRRYKARYIKRDLRTASSELNMQDKDGGKEGKGRRRSKNYDKVRDTEDADGHLLSSK